MKRHDYAMNCWDSSVMTALCARQGYHCNSKGEFVLEKGKKGDKDCTDDVPCICVNLFPQPRCFLQGSGALGCIAGKGGLHKRLEARAFNWEEDNMVKSEGIGNLVSVDVLE